MKTNNLELAMSLASITGKPLEDFYETKSNQQTEERSMAMEEKNHPTPIREDIPEVRPIQAEITRDLPSGDGGSDGYLTSLSKKWKGEIIGGRLLKCERLMTRSEYLKTIKEFKTQEDLYESPLLFLLFRSEEQMEANFSLWIDTVLTRINR